jgi:hypothetical protein
VGSSPPLLRFHRGGGGARVGMARSSCGLLRAHGWGTVVAQRISGNVLSLHWVGGGWRGSSRGRGRNGAPTDKARKQIQPESTANARRSEHAAPLRTRLANARGRRRLRRRQPRVPVPRSGCVLSLVRCDNAMPPTVRIAVTFFSAETSFDHRYIIGERCVYLRRIVQPSLVHSWQTSNTAT